MTEAYNRVPKARKEKLRREYTQIHIHTHTHKETRKKSTSTLQKYQLYTKGSSNEKNKEQKEVKYK